MKKIITRDLNGKVVNDNCLLDEMTDWSHNYETTELDRIKATVDHLQGLIVELVGATVSAINKPISINCVTVEPIVWRAHLPDLTDNKIDSIIQNTKTDIFNRMPWVTEIKISWLINQINETRYTIEDNGKDTIDAFFLVSHKNMCYEGFCSLWPKIQIPNNFIAKLTKGQK